LGIEEFASRWKEGCAFGKQEAWTVDLGPAIVLATYS
jgi:hypothetical protein